MIKLEKSAEPAVLLANSAAWTAQLVGKINAGLKLTESEKSRYRHRDVKAALVLETNGKCAYCESKLLHIHHGDVEHIYPKSLDATKTFEWENLTLACEICNQNKSDNDPYLNYIIDPYSVDPENHIIFFGCFVYPKGTVEGRSTITILELSRPELVEMRNSQLDKVMSILNTITDVTLPIVVRRDIYSDLITNEAGPKAPYSAMTKCAIRLMKDSIAAEVRAGQLEP